MPRITVISHHRHLETYSLELCKDRFTVGQLPLREVGEIEDLVHQLPMIRIQPYRVQRVFDDLEHILVGDYYIPDLKLPEEHRPIGKYGRMHREYLREVHPVRLNTLILTGELWTYLADLNEQAQERLDTIMEQMKATEGVTEELKRTCQMEWVQRCNNIHNRAEEIVLHEMIYS